MGLWDKAKGMLITDSGAKPPAAGKPDMSLDEMLEQLEDKPKTAVVPKLDEYRVAPGLKLPSNADGTTDFAPIYRDAGVSQTPFTAEQMLELLLSYPDGLPSDVKRTTVLLSLEAIGKNTGASLETVINDAAAKVAALNGYAESVKGMATAEVATAQEEIKALMAQIDARRKSMEATQAQLGQTHAAALSELERLKTVLEFFKQEHPAAPVPSPK